MSYNHKTDWYYEGNINSTLVNYFSNKGLKIIKDNSENVRVKGEDIIVENEKYLLVIEVKGYPTCYHTKGPKKGTPKVTKPNHQAKHWFNEVIMTSILNYKKHSKISNLKLAIGLPKFKVYEELVQNIEGYFSNNKLEFIVFFVDENSKVEEINFYRKIDNVI